MSDLTLLSALRPLSHTIRRRALAPLCILAVLPLGPLGCGTDAGPTGPLVLGPPDAESLSPPAPDPAPPPRCVEADAPGGRQRVLSSAAPQAVRDHPAPNGCR